MDDIIPTEVYGIPLTPAETRLPGIRLYSLALNLAPEIMNLELRLYQGAGDKKWFVLGYGKPRKHDDLDMAIRDLKRLVLDAAYKASAFARRVNAAISDTYAPRSV